MRYEDLLVVPTTDEIYERMKATARARGADTDAWSSLSIPAIFLWCVAVLLRGLYELLAYFAKGAVFDERSQPDLADVYGKSQFGLSRLQATAAVFSITLENTSENTYDLALGDFALRTAAGQRYLLQADTVLPPGSVVAQFIAELPGLTGNVAADTINILETPLQGVSTGVGELSVPGTDSETIAAYVARCQSLFDGLGAGHSGFVAFLALQMDATLTKVKTRVDSSTSGQMIVYLGTIAGAASQQQCDDFTQLLQSLDVFQAVSVTVSAATIAQVSISGTVKVLPGELETAVADVDNAIAKWQSVVGYGGTIRESDYWRLPLGVTAEGQKISGIFSSSSIDFVDFDVVSTYNIDQWQLVVFVNNLVFVEPT